jgi:hypothetical protein
MLKIAGKPKLNSTLCLLGMSFKVVCQGMDQVCFHFVTNMDISVIVQRFLGWINYCEATHYSVRNKSSSGFLLAGALLETRFAVNSSSMLSR